VQKEGHTWNDRNRTVDGTNERKRASLSYPKWTLTSGGCLRSFRANEYSFSSRPMHFLIATFLLRELEKKNSDIQIKMLEVSQI